MKRLKVCYVQSEGGDVGAQPRRASDEIAVAERVDNVRLTPLTSRSSATTSRAAVEKFRLWDNGRRLRVLYLDGEAAVQEKVTAIAKEWEQLTNLTIDFVTSGAAEIRISFLDKGFSWSTVGTDALTVPRSQPTMNYGWLTPSTATREYHRVVRHEFGHALGMIHEHQNPAAAGQIPWDKPKVYAYYAQQGWSEDDVDHNIFDVYDEDTTNFSDFDPESIMQYAVPDELTVGSYSIGWNTEFSETDRSFMASQYPKDAPGIIERRGGRRAGCCRSRRWRRSRCLPLRHARRLDPHHRDHRLDRRGDDPPGAERPGRDRHVGRRPGPRHQRPHRAQTATGRLLAQRASQAARRLGHLRRRGHPPQILKAGGGTVSTAPDQTLTPTLDG